MKPRSGLGSCVLLMCLLVIACTRQTPGNPSSNPPQSSNQAQSTNNAATTPPAPAPAPTVAEEKREAAAPPVQPAPPPPPVVLPAGTVLTVRTSEAIGAKSSQVGSPFQAVVAQAVSHNGHTAIPAGATVTGKIVTAHQGGKIKGESDLALQLTSIKVKGVSYAITTEQYLQQQKGKGGRTAKMGAGGGAAGAVIGGIAGGGKGAAIGALAGGGAGVAGSAMTGNKELTIPAESVLEFKLAQPLKLSTHAAQSAASDSSH